MSISKEETSNVLTSDKFHNKNCYNYLRNLKIPDFVLESYPYLAEIKSLSQNYDPNFPYGDLYKRFFDYIDDKTIINDLYNKKTQFKQDIEYRLTFARAKLEQQEKIKDNVKGVLLENVMGSNRKNLAEEIAKLELDLSTIEEQLDSFFISIYANDNKILEDTYEVIKDITLAHTPVSSAIKSSIAERTKDKGDLINKTSRTPSESESTISRLGSVFSDNYKPQHTTSLSTERHYKWNEGNSVKEYRFGTQGQRHEGETQVSPLFKQFLEVQAKNAKKNNITNDPGITHIYFNNLGRDRTDFEGKQEKALTEQLEHLENDHSNVAVITLPADKGLMDHHDYRNINAIYKSEDIKDEFLKIASQDPECTQSIKDFYISEKIRKLLFKDEHGYSREAEKTKLSELINKSFTALGLENEKELSPAQRQAVWFHFIKCELTNHIISTLKSPDPNQISINFSCKDAIDRGGVSSAYYNLVNSFETDDVSPMSRDEFELALHAAPTMVKGRGMNGHIQILWNSVNLYVNKNIESLKQNPEKAWLIEWRDYNCPKARVQDLLKKRIPEMMKDLKDAKEASPNDNQLIDNGLEILDKISGQINKGLSGKRLLLQAAALTSAVSLNPTKENIAQYEKLIDKISIKYPVLNIIAGLMKSLAGLAVYAISKGNHQDMLNEGWSTVKSGLEITTRKELQSSMKQQIQILKLPKVVEPIDEQTLPAFNSFNK